ncbi:MAG: response regulator transcription factor [Candidatus Acidiferrales bacterium]
MEKTLQSWSPIVNVVLAEANQMNCQLVESAFRPRRFRVAIVASAVDSYRAFALLRDREPDIAVISAHLQEGPLEGFRVLRELQAAHLKTRAILLLDSRDRDLIIDAFRCGAHGVIARDEPLETLGKCIHAVHEGQVWANSQQLGYLLEALGQGMPIHVQDARGVNLLSKREEDVVRLVAEGLTNRGVSAQLKLSEHTVRNYLFRIFDKVGVSTRVELVLYCLQQRQNAAARSDAASDEALARMSGSGHRLETPAVPSIAPSPRPASFAAAHPSFQSSDSAPRLNTARAPTAG